MNPVHTSGGLAQLRDLLYRDPSPQAWGELTRCLERWPAQEPRGVALDYAEQHLGRWPSGLRAAPPGWLGLHQGAQAPPGGLGLARALRLGLVHLDREVLLDLLARPALQNIEHMSLSGVSLSADTLGALAQARVPAGLRHLMLHRARLREAQEDPSAAARAWSQLLRAPWLSQLESLWLGHVHFWPPEDIWAGVAPLEGLRELHLPVVFHINNSLGSLFQALPGSLEVFHLSSWFFHPAEVERMAACAPLQRIRRLLLVQTRTEDPAHWEHLADAIPDTVEQLSLSGSVLGPQGLLRVLGLARGRLRALDLSFTELERDSPPDLSALETPGLEFLDLSGLSKQLQENSSLLGAPWLGRLRGLRLSHAKMEDAALRRLARQVPFARLESLDLSRNALTAEGLGALLDELPGSLRALDLWSNELGDGGVQALLRSGRLQGLARLHLANTGLGDAGVKALAQSKALAGVRELVLSNNPDISQEGWSALLSSPHLHPEARRQVVFAAHLAGAQAQETPTGGPPAAHSMDTTWFAVDNQGHIGLFDSGEAGAVPEGVLSSHNDLFYQLQESLSQEGASKQATVDLRGHRLPWVEPSHSLYCGVGNCYGDFVLGLRSLEGCQRWFSRGSMMELWGRDAGEAQVLAAHIPKVEINRMMAEGICHAEDFPWPENLDLARSGLFFFDHLTENWISGPYGRQLVPERPLRLEELPQGLPEELHEALAASRLPVDFSQARHVQPVEHGPCSSWQMRYMDMKGGTHEMPED